MCYSLKVEHFDELLIILLLFHVTPAEVATSPPEVIRLACPSVRNGHQTESIVEVSYSVNILWTGLPDRYSVLKRCSADISVHSLGCVWEVLSSGNRDVNHTINTREDGWLLALAKTPDLI